MPLDAQLKSEVDAYIAQRQSVQNAVADSERQRDEHRRAERERAVSRALEERAPSGRESWFHMPKVTGFKSATIKIPDPSDNASEWSEQHVDKIGARLRVVQRIAREIERDGAESNPDRLKALAQSEEDLHNAITETLPAFANYFATLDATEAKLLAVPDLAPNDARGEQRDQADRALLETMYQGGEDVREHVRQWLTANPTDAAAALELTQLERVEGLEQTARANALLHAAARSRIPTPLTTWAKSVIRNRLAEANAADLAKLDRDRTGARERLPLLRMILAEIPR